MRTNRLKMECPAIYTICSRCVNREFLLEADVEKALLLDLLRRAEVFCGVNIYSYVIMDNHFHLVLSVPERQEVDDKELSRRLEVLYGEKLAGIYMSEIHGNDQRGFVMGETATREKFYERMYDISMYMKTVLERFSQGYNRRNGRCGPIWQGRFHSSLIEEQEDWVLTVCGYADLNPVRARMVKDPKDYAWSSYGMAVAGDMRARAGLMMLMANYGATSWRECQKEYRAYLYVHAREKGVREGGRAASGMFSEKEVRKVLAAGGELPLAARLCCRVRHFTRGMVIGSEMFVSKVMDENPSVFKNRARAGPSNDLAFPGLYSAKRCRRQG